VSGLRAAAPRRRVSAGRRRGHGGGCAEGLFAVSAQVSSVGVSPSEEGRAGPERTGARLVRWRLCGAQHVGPLRGAERRRARPDALGLVVPDHGGGVHRGRRSSGNLCQGGPLQTRQQRGGAERERTGDLQGKAVWNHSGRRSYVDVGGQEADPDCADEDESAGWKLLGFPAGRAVCC
ncbi:hypothetical protein AOLI_G00186690, partial [Acnodon oligacanthus]